MNAPIHDDQDGSNLTANSPPEPSLAANISASRDAAPSVIQQNKFIILALVAVTLAVVFVLPQFVTEPWAGGNPDQAAAPPPAATVVAPSTAAEKTRYRQQSQSVLANIIATRDALQAQGVLTWAAPEFQQAMGLIEAGDEQYSYGEYRASLDNYGAALSQLETLAELAQTKLTQAITEGMAALETMNINVVTRNTELALAIAADDPRVQEMNRRLQSLPQLLESMTQADQALAEGVLDRAREHYAQANSIDPAHQRAATALAEVKKEITDRQFRRHMSRGYAALDQGDLQAARSAFRDAGSVYPDHSAIAQALAQAGNQEAQRSVSEALNQAASLEAAEQWHEAVTAYETLLQQDPSLTQAKVKLIPTRVRSQLDSRLSDLLDDPLSLSNRAVHQRARQTLADAQGIARPGPRLLGQIEQLSRQLELSVAEVNVEFKSDNQTRVTLFRVAELGQFESRAVILKPGRYTAAGTRKGYRDVRVDFVITGEPLETPIVVRCEEPI